MTQGDPRAIVVGGGIMGLCAAWALARADWRVTLFEQGPLPNPLGASADRHRLIRHPYAAERGYTRMVSAAYGAWQALWPDLGRRFYAPTGTLVLETSRGSWAADSMRCLEQEGIAFRRLDAPALAREFPLVRAEGVRYAIHLATGGALFADQIVAALARYLARREVDLRPHAPVREIDPDRCRVRLGDATAAADALVIAAGPWAPRLVPGLRGRVVPSRQVVAYLAPPADLAAQWAAHPMIIDIDPSTGFYLVPPRGEAGLKIGDHGATLRGEPDRDREVLPEEAERLMALGPGRLRDFDRYRFVEARTCFYDVAPEERFVVEPLGPRAWVMSGFSGHGFKFAPLLALELVRALGGMRSAASLALWAAGRLPVVKDAPISAGDVA